MIYVVDLAYYGVSRAKDWVSVDCGTNILKSQNERETRKMLTNVMGE